MLVIIGATPEGRKELVGFQVGVRESAQSWRELLVDLQARGLTVTPELATGDGALGFWKALEEVSPTTRHQRCTVHKTVNVLDKLPKSVQPAAKADLREAWTAPDRATAEAAIASFAEKFGAKYEKAVICLVKDRDALLTFDDFPAEHWDHLRTSDEIDKSVSLPRQSGARRSDRQESGEGARLLGGDLRCGRVGGGPARLDRERVRGGRLLGWSRHGRPAPPCRIKTIRPCPWRRSASLAVLAASDRPGARKRARPARRWPSPDRAAP